MALKASTGMVTLRKCCQLNAENAAPVQSPVPRPVPVPFPLALRAVAVVTCV